MGASRDALQGLGAGAGWRATVEGFRARYGRGASRAMAQRYNITMRTAQRALKGETAHPKFTDTGEFNADRAARALRGMGSASAGRVSVNYDGEDEGGREIGDVELDADELDRIAALIEDEDWDAASDEMDKAILNEYGAGLGESLNVTAYQDGLQFRPRGGGS